MKYEQDTARPPPLVEGSEDAMVEEAISEETESSDEEFVDLGDGAAAPGPQSRASARRDVEAQRKQCLHTLHFATHVIARPLSRRCVYFIVLWNGVSARALADYIHEQGAGVDYVQKFGRYCCWSWPEVPACRWSTNCSRGKLQPSSPERWIAYRVPSHNI